jgi:4-hydroxybenzoyl-CoA thioesterase
MAFRTQIRVRFGDVDHAGIVYYPHFFIYFHEAFEDFFDDAGLRYDLLLNRRRIGFPTVHIETDYSQPLRYGDALDIELTVPRVGARSATFRYRGFRHQDGLQSVDAQITCACVDLDSFRAVEVPDDLRQLFTRFAT